jgi:hypothetical protein
LQALLAEGERLNHQRLREQIFGGKIDGIAKRPNIDLAKVAAFEKSVQEYVRTKLPPAARPSPTNAPSAATPPASVASVPASASVAAEKIPVPADNPNYQLWKEFVSQVENFARQHPQAAGEIINYSKLKVWLVGGITDPQTNGNSRKDLDIVIEPPDDLPRPIEAALRAFQSFLSPSHDNAPMLHIMVGEAVMSENMPEITAYITEALSRGLANAKAIGAPANAGGINFTQLPAVIQPAPLSAGAGTVPLARQVNSFGGDSPLLDKEWQQIQRMLSGGIIPSSQRLKEFLISSCSSPDCQKELDKALSAIADIFRLEEERCAASEPALKQILVLLEQDKPAGELKLALAQIQVEEKEPEIVGP